MSSPLRSVSTLGPVVEVLEDDGLPPPLVLVLVPSVGDAVGSSVVDGSLGSLVLEGSLGSLVGSVGPVVGSVGSVVGSVGVVVGATPSIVTGKPPLVPVGSALKVTRASPEASAGTVNFTEAVPWLAG